MMVAGRGIFLLFFPLLLLPIGSSLSGALAQEDDNDDTIRIACIFDTTGYDWSPDVFEVTFQLINDGWWGILPTSTTTSSSNNGTSTTRTRVTYELMDSNCDAMAATNAYWTMFHNDHNNNDDDNHTTQQPLRRFHGIVGPRCSGAAIALGRFAGLEEIPQISPTTNSAILSDKTQFPLFSRLVPPSDERGHVGALVATLRQFGWDRIGILATDTDYSKQRVRNLRKAWIGSHGNNTTKWVGQVAFDVSFHVDEDTNQVDLEHANQALSSIATIHEEQDDPKVIILVGHDRHKRDVLREAYAHRYFSPATVWLGVPSHQIKDIRYDLQRQDEQEELHIPGWFEIAPRLNNRDPEYQRFLAALRLHQLEHGKEVVLQLPTHADHLVDAIRAMVLALVQTKATDRTNGTAVVQTLRNLQFDGVGGRVEFDPATGDPKAPVFSILNAQSAATGRVQWTDIGTTSTTIGSVQLTHGLASVCFSAQEGCGLAAPPDDSFPPSDDKEIPIWAICLVGFFLLTMMAFLCLACKFRAIQQAKATIEQELETFRESVVGMKTAECHYIPLIQNRKTDEQDDLEMNVNRRQSFYMPGYQQMMISFRRPSAGKLLNNKDSSSRRSVRGAFRDSVLKSISRQLHLPNQEGVDITLGRPVPDELENEPRLVACPGDVIQITIQRIDGWAFGTKLFHSDEVAERQLVTLALMNIASEDVEERVSTETGWLEIENTRDPSKQDLAQLHQTMGDATEALDPPSHWKNMTDATTALRVEIEAGNEEREAVLASFQATLPSNTKIQSVQRIQNLALWQSYVVKRRAVYHRETGHFPRDDGKEEQCRTLQKIERKWVFHGCDSDVVDKIVQQGFNRSFCGKNATLYGKGVYFARDSAYSSATVYARPDEDGLQYILACRVVVGEYCVGREDALTPDVREEQSQILFDSTVDNVEDPTLFVTYHDAQAYPEYLIAFSIPEGGDLALLRELEQAGASASTSNLSTIHQSTEGRSSVRFGDDGTPISAETKVSLCYDAEGTPIPSDNAGKRKPSSVLYGAEGTPVTMKSTPPQPAIRYGAEGKPLSSDDFGKEKTCAVQYGPEGKPIMVEGQRQHQIRYGPEGKPLASDDSAAKPSIVYGAEGKPIAVDGQCRKSQQPIRYGAEGKPIRYGAEGQVLDVAPAGLLGKAASVQYGPEGQVLDVGSVRLNQGQSHGAPEKITAAFTPQKTAFHQSKDTASGRSLLDETETAAETEDISEEMTG
ncbi:TCDD-inducible poly [ADP-ribose] polymerase [Seminavis robusta]|uniref:Poly [ADP-ribose] polymerase n=1 Tax=Seminavis robusta TaxID=568900 RepID=A0A9N8DFF0_9STRA|nr:TCDD-inducible poly [ADP-ribose] polymerase [Seminavis robusta]|eukprot:Sro131_g062340.1 TCDD-inducible poly [ADP-ribose] polymerase (1239) ;mRNA; r:73465-77339